MNKLKVALMGGFTLNSENIRGGVQAATMSLIEGLSEIDGLDLHIITSRPNGWHSEDKFNHNFVVHFLDPYQHFERINLYKRLKKNIYKELDRIQPDLIHVQEAGAEAYISVRTKIPTVVTIHGIRAEDCKYTSSFPKKIRLYYDSLFIEPSVIRNVNYLISISKYVTEYFYQQFRPDIQIKYISNAVDDKFFSIAYENNQMIILFAGRVISIKRIVDLISALRLVIIKFPQVKLHIAGETKSEPSYVKVVKKTIEQMGLSNHVFLLGQLNQNELIEEYKKCILVVLPSSQENSPIVIAQAFAAGKPVVATNIGGVPEMIGLQGERGYLFEVGNVKALAESIILLLQNSEKRIQIGNTCQDFAIKNYKKDAIANKTFEFYQYIHAKENQSNE